jgi:hypothetical protein
MCQCPGQKAKENLKGHCGCYFSVSPTAKHYHRRDWALGTCEVGTSGEWPVVIISGLQTWNRVTRDWRKS